jgi:hypothetical protein
VQVSKAQKIDLQQFYPCPSCQRKGTLQPIALTDALGCDRCHLIFVVQDDGQSLVLLGGIDAYRRTWYWVGDKWELSQAANQKPHNLYRSGFILMFSLLAIFFLWYVAFQTPSHFILMIVLLLLVSLGFLMMRQDF